MKVLWPLKDDFVALVDDDKFVIVRVFKLEHVFVMQLDFRYHMFPSFKRRFVSTSEQFRREKQQNVLQIGLPIKDKRKENGDN